MRTPRDAAANEDRIECIMAGHTENRKANFVFGGGVIALFSPYCVANEIEMPR